MAQAILDHEKMICYNGLPSDYTQEDKQCQMCWDPFTEEVNWCVYCYHPSDEKTVIINKSTMSWTLNIDAGSSGMQNRGKSGRLGKGKARNPYFKRKRKEESKNKKIIKKYKKGKNYVKTDDNDKSSQNDSDNDLKMRISKK